MYKLNVLKFVEEYLIGEIDFKNITNVIIYEKFIYQLKSSLIITCDKFEKN